MGHEQSNKGRRRYGQRCVGRRERQPCFGEALNGGLAFDFFRECLGLPTCTQMVSIELSIFMLGVDPVRKIGEVTVKGGLKPYMTSYCGGYTLSESTIDAIDEVFPLTLNASTGKYEGHGKFFSIVVAPSGKVFLGNLVLDQRLDTTPYKATTTVPCALAADMDPNVEIPKD